jgi:hypothetical protein
MPLDKNINNLEKDKFAETGSGATAVRIIGDASNPIPVTSGGVTSYSKRIDSVGDTIIYIGESDVGSSESSAVWRIQKITFTDSGNDADIKWADGVSSFTKVWNDRLTYSYS